MALAFDEQSVRRIIRSVLVTERRDRSRQVRGKRPRGYPPGEIGFDRIRGLATEDFSSSSPLIHIDGVSATRGANPLEDPDDDEETLEVRNELGFAGLDNAIIYAEYHVDSEEWHIYAVELVDQLSLSDFRVSGTELQIKTRSIQGYADGVESDWQTVHTGTTCS